jgi:hypothetical protein
MSAPKAKPDVVEYAQTMQVFVDDLCSIEAIGGVVHLVFTSQRRDVAYPAALARVVEVRLLATPQNVQAMGRAMMAGRVDAPQAALDGDGTVAVH